MALRLSKVFICSLVAPAPKGSYCSEPSLGADFGF